MEDNCFNHCKQLQHCLFLKNNVELKKLSSNVFCGCQQLKEFKISSSIKEIENNVFENCSLQSICIPSTISIIPSKCFYNCYYLSSIQLSNEIKILKEMCFYNCRELESIELSSQLTKIENDCFYNCYSLQSIEIPKECSVIGKQ